MLQPCLTSTGLPLRPHDHPNVQVWPKCQTHSKRNYHGFMIYSNTDLARLVMVLRMVVLHQLPSLHVCRLLVEYRREVLDNV